MRNDYANRIVSLCLMLDEYTTAGVKQHNKAMDGLSIIYHELEADKEYAQELYLYLMGHDDDRVKATAAAHSLGLNINVPIAKKTLIKIMRNSSKPLARFNAEMTLQVWKEQGFLKF